MRTFNLIVLAIFGFFMVAGVIAVAMFGKFGGDGEDTVEARATIWGTLPASIVSNVVSSYNKSNDDVLSVTYREIPLTSFNTEFVEALASGRGPDAVLISHKQLLKQENKLFLVPFETYPERTFRDTYAEGAEIFLTHRGVLGFPVLIDPLVMYWNRSILTNARIANPPTYWDELLPLGETLTKKDNAFNIDQSVVALGEYRNVTNAQEIISTLILQAGDPITTRTSAGQVSFVLGGGFGLPEAPADSALRFYTEFANPVKPAYSWNKSLPASRDTFLRGDLALYFGFASELFGIQESNPNLNFDLAPILQIRDSTLATTYGDIYGFSIVNQSQARAEAYAAIQHLTGAEAAGLFAAAASLPPARRDLLAQSSLDPYEVILYQEALIAQAFLDPDPLQSGAIFERLVEDILSGRASISNAVKEASARLNNLAR